MRFLAVVFHYFVWHYGRSLIQFSRIYRRLVVFLFNFFSVPILARSYLAPWRRLGETYPTDGFNPVAIASVFVVNAIMRLVGIILRTVMILLGTAVTILVAVFYPLALLGWLLLPVLVAILILLGLGLLFG